jgi:hypothetical protein
MGLARYKDGNTDLVFPVRPGQETAVAASARGFMNDRREGPRRSAIRWGRFRRNARLVRQIEVDQAVLLGEADRDVALRTIELGLRLQDLEGCCIQRSWDDELRSPSVSPLCWLVDDVDRGPVARAGAPA